MDKQSLLSFYRKKMQDVSVKAVGDTKHGNYTLMINHMIRKLQDKHIEEIFARSEKENWSRQKILDAVLMSRYTANIIMIEQRNKIWPYDYMSFSRRMVSCGNHFAKKFFRIL